VAALVAQAVFPLVFPAPAALRVVSPAGFRVALPVDFRAGSQAAETLMRHLPVAVFRAALPVVSPVDFRVALPAGFPAQVALPVVSQVECLMVPPGEQAMSAALSMTWLL
jgi:hypothetical protein